MAEPRTQLRLAVAADFPRLAAIELAAARLFPPGRVPDVEETLPLDLLKQGLAEQLLWVAEQQAVVVGFTLSGVHQEYLHLLEVAVHPDWGRQGIGRQLVSQVLEQAGRRGLPGVTLTTFRDLAFNGPFYASLGFVEIPAHQCSAIIADIIARELALGMVERIGMLCKVELD